MATKHHVKFVRAIVLMLIVAFVLPFTLSACNNATNEYGGTTEKLVVYNWEDYIDESEETSRLDAFAEYYEAVTGNTLEIVYTTFDTNETMLTKVLNNDANSVDLICPSEYAIQKLMASGRLNSITDLVNEYNGTHFDLTGEDLSFQSIGGGNMSSTEPSFVAEIEAAFDGISAGNGVTADMTDYMVPYMMGTLGILYNTTVLTREQVEEAGWGLLWNETGIDDIENKILMKDSVRDTYVAAVMYMREYGLLPDGFDQKSVPELINCTDVALRNAVEEVLIAQREHISGYEVDFGKDDMLNEIVYVDLAWSGDALWAIEESLYETGEFDEDGNAVEDYLLDYYVPVDKSNDENNPTGNIWFDGWVIPKNAPNKLAATMFIDFMNAPENAIYNSIYIGYTSGVAKDKLMYAQDDEGNILVEDGENVINEDVFNALVDSEYAYALDDAENNPDGSYDSFFEFFSDERRYTTATSELGVMRDFGTENDNMVAMWENAKTGSDTPWVLIWATVSMIGLAALVAAIIAIKNKVRFRPRKVGDN